MVIAVIEIILYLPGMYCPFVYDEPRYIAASPQIRQGAWQECVKGHLLRAIPKASYALTWRAVKDKPFWWRFSQVMLHVLTTTLLAFLVWGVSHAMHSKTCIWNGIAASALFGLHPLATESALYTWARPTSLVLTFTITSLLLLLGANRNSGLKRIGLIIAAGISILLCAMCKETGIIMAIPVFIAGLYLLLPGSRKWILLIPAAACALPFVIQQGHVYPVLKTRMAWEVIQPHLWLQTRGFIKYLRLLVPIPGQYTISHLTIPGTVMLAAVSVAILAVWFYSIIMTAKRGRILGCLGLVIALSSLGTYLVFPGIPVVEYKAYGLLTGASLCLVDICEWLTTAKYPRAKFIVATVLSLLLCLCAYATSANTAQWQTPERLWSAGIKAEPDNPDPRAAVAQLQYKAGELQKAADNIEIAAGQVHDLVAQYGKLPFVSWGWILHGLGNIRYKQKRIKAASMAYSEALEYSPNSIPLRMDVCRFLMNTGRLEKALWFLEQTRPILRDAHDHQLFNEIKKEISSKQQKRKIR